MLIMNEKQFEENRFAVQIVSKGSFADRASNPEKTFIIEVTTLRLNWVALNSWLKAHTMNCRDCYEDGPAGDAEWQEVLEKNKLDLADFETKIKTALGMDADKHVVITQAQAEIFTAVHIYQA